MVAIVSKIGKILECLMGSQLSESELSRQSGVSQATINRILSGATPDPKISTITPLANHFKISVDQLLGLKPLQSAMTNIEAQIHSLPILDWPDIGKDPLEMTKLTQHYTITSYEVSANAYALVIMQRSLPLPFSYGATLIIDPDYQIEDGQFMIITANNSASLRKIVIDGNDTWLMPLTEGISAIQLNDNIELNGTVVQIQLPMVEANDGD